MIKAWISSHLLSVLAVVALVSFLGGIGAHRVWVKAGERDEAVAIVQDAKDKTAAKDKRDTARAEKRQARRAKEDELTTDLEKHLAKHPDDYRGRVPVDGVRILNSL